MRSVIRWVVGSFVRKRQGGQSWLGYGTKKRKRDKTHLDDIGPNDLLYPPPAHLLPLSTQKPMLNLVIIPERLRHIEPIQISPQQSSNLGHVFLLHLAETGDTGVRGNRVLLYETSDGASPGKGGEANVDEFGGVEVAMEVSVEIGMKWGSNTSVLKWKGFWRAACFDLPTGTDRSREDDTSSVDGLPDICQIDSSGDFFD